MSMKYFLVLIVVACSTEGASSQIHDTHENNREGSLRVFPVFQRWSIQDGDAFSETSVELSLYQPVGRQTTISLRGAGATAGGDITTLSGLADAQLAIQHRLEKQHLVLSLGVNLPSGRKELTSDEFQTSLLLSNRLFDLQTPNFGMGLNINPGVIWAFQVGENVVLGLGGSYQYKGKFKPLEGLGDYDPGDEVLLTAGMDVAPGKTETASVDIVFTAYGKDKLDGDEVFASGNKVVANLQYRKYFDYDQLRVIARYRTKAKNEFAVGNSLVTEQEKTDPDEFDLLGSYMIWFNEGFSMSILGEGRFYQAISASSSGRNLLGVGVAPAFLVSSSISIPTRLKFQFGSLKGGTSVTGIELGVGVEVTY